MQNQEHYQLVLASASPRRAELLQQLGVQVMLYPVDIDESALQGEPLEAQVLRLATGKARAGRSAMMQRGIDLPVLGSDTLVEVDNEVLGKPENEAQAVAMLTKLSARTHKVHTAVTVVASDGEYSATSTSKVEFAELSPSDIQAYVQTGEPMDKAGAYAIQGIAGQFVKSLSGSYSGVMGLPLYETARLLLACGIKTI